MAGAHRSSAFRSTRRGGSWREAGCGVGRGRAVERGVEAGGVVASSSAMSLPAALRTPSLQSSTLEGSGGWGRGRGRRSRGGSAPPLPFIPPRGIWWGRCGRRSECSMTMDSQQVPALELIDLEVGGMTCASCAARVEKKLNRLEGGGASVNYADRKSVV